MAVARWLERPELLIFPLIGAAGCVCRQSGLLSGKTIFRSREECCYFLQRTARWRCRSFHKSVQTSKIVGSTRKTGDRSYFIGIRSGARLWEIQRNPSMEKQPMADTLDFKPAIAEADREIDTKWGWFVALGISELILGGVASANLFLANFISVLVIGASMLVSGILQFLHAFTQSHLHGFMFWVFSGIVYGVAGGIILYDPLLASLTLALLAGAFLLFAGIFRVCAGVLSRPATGWRWVVAAGALTSCVGVLLLVGWPSISIWILGAMLVVDLALQGWGLIAFGLAMKGHEHRISSRWRVTK
jgi:uncharacterized membrane protein HdeD (DUF308 family)